MAERVIDGLEAGYILGHSRREIRRLIHQATILQPITSRLLKDAGIGPGMRVLDLGCGAGDVSMLAAKLVGPTGSVVGLDRNPGFRGRACTSLKKGLAQSLDPTSRGDIFFIKAGDNQDRLAWIVSGEQYLAKW